MRTCNLCDRRHCALGYCMKHYQQNKRTGSPNPTIGHHGYVGTKMYTQWQYMKQKCNNKKHFSYHIYGEKGIKYDPRWNVFENFLEDMGEMPEGYILDRKNHKEDFSKENCIWVKKELAFSPKTTRIITYKGVTKGLRQWALEYDLDHQVLGRRIQANWDVKEALETPARKYERRK